MRFWGFLAAVGAAALVACSEQPASLALPGEEPFLATPAEPARLAIVLSSGALRGLAHIGVLRALEAEGIRPDLIVGSSVGALVGAINASGVRADEVGRVVAAEDEAALSLDDYRLRRVARAAEALATRYERPGDTTRIDAIFMVPGRWPRHMANVWHG